MTVRAVGRWAYVVVVALVSVALVGPNLRLYRTAMGTDEVVAQLRFLRGELDRGMGERMQRQFPEGYFFSYVLYGLAWAEVAGRRGSERAEGLREARWALERLDSPAGRAAFDPGLRPAYGIFHAGWSTWLRGKVVELAGTAAPEAERFRADTATIAEEMERAGPFLAAYPGQAWPVDSVVAVAGLGLHDRLFSPRHAAARSRWVTAARARLDPGTGLLPHRVTPRVDGSRASSQVIIQRFLPEIDPEWGREQYAIFRRTFAVTRLGLPAIREYPLGQDGPGDVDSGPLLLGVSLSATVVAIGAARARGDGALAGPLTGLGEATGYPLGLGTTKRYAAGVMPIGDAFLAWSAATTPAATEQHPAVAGWWWRLPWHTLSLVIIAALWLPVARRGYRRLK